MLAWTQQNTMQSAMWTDLEWPQSHAISKTINMLTNKSEPSWLKTYSCSVRVEVLEAEGEVRRL